MSINFETHRAHFKCLKSNFARKYTILLTTLTMLGGLINDVFVKSFQNLFDLKFRFLGTFFAFFLLFIFLIQAIYLCYKEKSNTDLFIFHLSGIQFSLIELEEIVGKKYFKDIATLDVSEFQSTNKSSNWLGGIEFQDDFIKNYLHLGLKTYSEIHYIGLAPIPFVIHLGYHFGSRFNIRYYERQRTPVGDANPWNWSRSEVNPRWNIQILGKSIDTKGKDVFLTIEQSYPINKNDLPEITGGTKIIRIKVPSPSIHDLQSEKQLHEISNKMSETFDKLRDCNVIHIFAAVPVATAFVIGQNIKKSLNPEVVIYRFKKSSDQIYKEVYRINEISDN